MTGAGGVRLVPAGRVPMVGAVAAFDEDRGLGEIESGAGDLVPFHCTAITDGTRTISPGTTVAFELVAGRLGRLEATAVRPLYGVRAGEGGSPGGSPAARPVGAADPWPATEVVGEAANTVPGEGSAVPLATGPSPSGEGAPGGDEAGVGQAGVDEVEAGDRTPPPPPPWAPVPEVVVEPAPATEVVEAAPMAAAGQPVPTDPAASWPLGGGEPTPVSGTPAVVDPAPAPAPAPVPGTLDAGPSVPGDGSSGPDSSDVITGEEPTPWSSTPPDGAPERVDDRVDVPDRVDAPERSGPPVDGGPASGQHGQQQDGSLGIRPSFDSTPYTGEVRVGGAPAAAHPEPRVDEPPGFHPDFWSPFARGRAGPPPTWMTPVTRRDEDPVSETDVEDQDPGSEGR